MNIQVYNYSMLNTKKIGTLKKPGYAVLFCLLIIIITGTSTYVSGKVGVFDVNSIHISLTKNSHPYWLNLKKDLEKELVDLNHKRLWEVNLKDIENKLKNVEWIHAFNIQKFIPNRISINIEQREIIAVYVNKNGVTTPLSIDGKLLPNSSLTKTPVVPVINQEKIIKDQTIRNKLANIVSKFPEQGNFSLNSIEQISLDKRNTLWFHVGKMKIKINQENTLKKIKRLNRLIKYLETKKNCKLRH